MADAGRRGRINGPAINDHGLTYTDWHFNISDVSIRLSLLLYNVITLDYLVSVTLFDSA